MANRCTSCGTDIRWAITTGGKPIPVNVHSAPNGNIRYTGASRPGRFGMQAEVEVLGPLEQQMCTEALYLAHFVTCPHADRHRR